MAGKYILIRKQYRVDTSDQTNPYINLYFLFVDDPNSVISYQKEVIGNTPADCAEASIKEICDHLKIDDYKPIYDFLTYRFPNFFRTKLVGNSYTAHTFRNFTLGKWATIENNYIDIDKLREPHQLVGEITGYTELSNNIEAKFSISDTTKDGYKLVQSETKMIGKEELRFNGYSYMYDYTDKVKPYTTFQTTLFITSIEGILSFYKNTIPFFKDYYDLLYMESYFGFGYDIEFKFIEYFSDTKVRCDISLNNIKFIKGLNPSIQIPKASVLGVYGWQNRVSDDMITNLTQAELQAIGFDGTVPPYNPTPGPSTGGGGGGEWNPLPTPTIPDLPEINPDYGSTDPAPTVPDASNPNVNTGVGPYGSGATPDNVTPGQQLPGDAKPTVPLAGQHGGQRLMVESYAMDGTMMQVLRDTLWRRDTLAKLKDIFEAPEDLIVNIHRLPFNCSIYTNPPEKIDLTWILPDSVYNVTGRPINSPLVTWKYGEVKIPRYYNTYLDFSPYSSAKMYIPFVGFVQLDSKEVVGHTVSLGYSCDLISGDGTATLSSDGIGIIGTYATNFAMQIPITSRNFNAVAVGAIEKFASLAMTAVGGSFANGNALPMIPQSTGGMLNVSQPGVNAHQTQTLLSNTAPAPALPPAGNLTSNVEQQSMVAMYNMPISDSSPSQAVSGITLPTVHPSQLLASAMQAFRVPEQPANRQSGGLGGNTGWTSPLTPYIYITYNTPNWSTKHTNLFGLSSNIVAAIGTFKGYTEFGSIQLNAGGIMLDEQEELKRLLTGGVVI